MITSIQNTNFRGRRAAIDVTPDVFSDCVPVLIDAGFKIVGSASTRGEIDPMVRLIIMGDALPSECENGEGIRKVNLILYQERYGRQRIVRVKEVYLVEGAEPITC